MKFEDATIDDLDELVSTSKVWYDAMDFDNYGKRYDLETVYARWKESLLSSVYDVIVAREKNVIIGAFGIGYQMNHSWFKGVLQGYERVFHADPRLPEFTQGKVMLGLLNAMLPKMAAREHQGVFVGCDPRYPEVMKMLQRKGAVPVLNTVMFRGD